MYDIGESTTNRKIDAAISSVMRAVKRLEKSERNQHGGYKFTGIDEFLEMTGKLCAEHGLNVLMDEDACEVIPDFVATKVGRVAGLRLCYTFVLRCAGEQLGPFRRTVIVPANMGSQAFGAAQSYALKQFLRATFQIPTGDKMEDVNAHSTGTFGYSSTPSDHDHMPTDNVKAGAVKANGKYIMSDGPAKTMTELKRQMGELRRALESVSTREELNKIVDETYADLIVQCQADQPGWWSGEGMPLEFVPPERVIANLSHHFDAVDEDAAMMAARMP